MKLIGATEEDAEESYMELADSLWRSLRGRAESRTRCLHNVQSQHFWLNIVVSLILQYSILKVGRSIRL